jgi:hypothetical protein
MTSGANVTSDKAVSASHTTSSTSISSTNKVVDAASKNVANGVAGLDSSGQISSAQLPAIAITSVYTVGSQAAQLALTSQEGDVAVRTDESKSYIKNTGTASTMADWTLLQTPLDVVLSVNGNTGAVSITPASIGAATTSHTHAPADITGTAVITSDSRLSDSRTPTSHASSHGSAGSDPITIAQSQVTNLTTDLADKQASSVNLTTAAAQGTASVRAIAGDGTALTAAASDHSHTGLTVQAAGTASVRALGTGATEAAAGNHTHTGLTVQAAGTASVRALGTGATEAAAGNDSRLSDTRTPTAHKSSHATGGSDALVPSDIGAAPTASPTFTGTVTIPGSVAGIVRATSGGVLSQSKLVDSDVSSGANITSTKFQLPTIFMWSNTAQVIASGSTVVGIGLNAADQTGDTTYLSYSLGSASGTSHTAGYIQINYGCTILVSAHIGWTTNATGGRAMLIRHVDSGGTVIDRPGVSIPANALVQNTDLSYIMKCNTLDTIRIDARQDSGINLGWSGSSSPAQSNNALRVTVLSS